MTTLEEIAKLKADMAALTTAGDASAARIKALESELAQAQSANAQGAQALKDSAAELAEETAKVTALTVENAALRKAQTEFEAKVESAAVAKAAAITGSTGTRAPIDSKPGAAAAEQLANQWAAITDPIEKSRFFQANKAALITLLR